MGNTCVICGEVLIQDRETIKKYENFGLETKICQDCLSIPIRCTKSTMTLNEMLHRIRALRGDH